jgi:hypothetical protein
VWCRCSFFSHFQCLLGRSRSLGFAPSIRKSLFPPRPSPHKVSDFQSCFFSIRLNFAVDVVSCVTSNFLIISDTLFTTSFPVIHVLLCSGTGIVFAADWKCTDIVLEKPPGFCRSVSMAKSSAYWIMMSLFVEFRVV